MSKHFKLTLKGYKLALEGMIVNARISGGLEVEVPSPEWFLLQEYFQVPLTFHSSLIVLSFAAAIVS